MLTTTVNEYELPLELVREARELALRRYDLWGKQLHIDLDMMVRTAMHDLAVRACWEYFRHGKDIK